MVVGPGRDFPLDKGINSLHCSTLIDGLKVDLFAFVALFYIDHIHTNPGCCRLDVYVCGYISIKQICLM